MTSSAIERALQIFLYWRKPENGIDLVTHLPGGDVKREVQFMRGVQITQRWFIGVYTLSKRSDFE